MVAVILSEPDAPRCTRSLVQASVRRMSAANLLEAYMKIDRSNLRRSYLLVDELRDQYDVNVIPVMPDQIILARRAFHQFGKGSGHGAKLNYGDCFAYALAKQTGESLLFVGNDFGRTDIEVA